MPNGSGLGAWTVDVTYDLSVVNLAACTASVSTCNQTYVPNKVRVAGASTDGLTGTQALANLTFQAVGATNTSTLLAVSIVDFADTAGNSLPALAGDGLITIWPAPTITTISPSSGPGRGGTFASISGSNFQSGANVNFGGRAASEVVIQNPSSLIARTPAHSRVVGDVNGNGSVTALDALCVLRAVAALPATSACPADQLASAVDVVVSNPDGQSGSLISGFTYQQADVSGNGTVTAVDALCVLRTVATLPPTTACPAVPTSTPTPTATAAATTTAVPTQTPTALPAQTSTPASTLAPAPATATPTVATGVPRT